MRLLRKTHASDTSGKVKKAAMLLLMTGSKISQGSYNS